MCDAYPEYVWKLLKPLVPNGDNLKDVTMDNQQG